MDSGKYAAAAMGVCSAATEALAMPALQLDGWKVKGFGATQSFGEERKLGERKRGREERRTFVSIHG